MPTTNASLLDRLKSWPLLILPHQLLSRLVRHATRWQSAWWKDTLIKLFIRHFNVDMSEAEFPGADGYPDFNRFFTRALTAGARPLRRNIASRRRGASTQAPHRRINPENQP